MALSNTLADVEADLIANLTALGTPLAAVTFRRGEKSLLQMDVPPRIVWVRMPGIFEPREQGTARDPRSTARILRTHIAHVDAYCWAAANPDNGNDDTDCEALADTLVASVYRQAHGSFAVLSDQRPQPGWLKQGYLSVVSFSFRAPILDVKPIAIVGPPFAMPFDQSMTPIPPGVLQAPGDTSPMPPPPPPGALPLGDTDNTDGGEEIDFDANVPSWNRSAPPSGINTYVLPADTQTTRRTIGWLSGLPPVVVAPAGWRIFDPLKGTLGASYTYADAPGEIYTWLSDVFDQVIWAQ